MTLCNFNADLSFQMDGENCKMICFPATVRYLNKKFMFAGSTIPLAMPLEMIGQKQILTGFI